MDYWNSAFREALVSGTLASLLSAAALVWAARREIKAPAAAANATSHWVWGDRALRQNEATLRYTVPGYLIHHGASVFWALLHALAWGKRRQAAEPGPAAVSSAATAAAACLVDFRLTPRRLTPGFEHRLSRPALAGVYACFAVGLALGSLAVRRLRRS